ncbi:MAG: SDR family oxidoreductase [Paludibacteraceae bacterium]|nr:SDR family oxidoreductase [Paludibacteraceae bacterium]
MEAHGLLKNKRGIIFGAVDEQSLAWHVAEQCHAEGARMVLTNSQFGLQLGNIRRLSEMTESPVIECDATDVEQLRALLSESMRLLGGPLDFILHAVALSPNIRRRRSYDNINYSYFQQTLDISALSLHKLLQTAKETDAIAEWGSVVALSYIAAHKPICGYVDMGDAKALLESITRSFGQVYGEEKHVRINTISQSPTRTRATEQFPELHIMQTFAGDMSPLGNADAESCANACVMLFSDYTRYITMQNIYNDGGFSASGLTSRYILNSKYVELRKNENKGNNTDTQH